MIIAMIIYAVIGAAIGIWVMVPSIKNGNSRYKITLAVYADGTALSYEKYALAIIGLLSMFMVYIVAWPFAVISAICIMLTQKWYS